MINRKIFCKSGPCNKIQLKNIKKDHKNTYVVQKYAKQSENAETNKSKWIILSNCFQDDVKHVLIAEIWKRRYYLSAHWLNGDVLLSNSAFFIERNFADLKDVSIDFCILYAESEPYLHFRFVWSTDLESIPHASTLTTITSTKFEVDMTIYCRVTALLLLIRYMTFWPWPFDLEQLSRMAGHAIILATKFEDPVPICSSVISCNVFHWTPLKTCTRREGGAKFSPSPNAFIVAYPTFHHSRTTGRVCGMSTNLENRQQR